MEEILQINFNDIDEKEEYKKIIYQVINKCFEVENLKETKLYINIILTNPQTIKDINKKYRNVDKETDCLSFPMFEKDELEEKLAKHEFTFQDILGDIIISIPRVIEQAKEYNHSFERELAYMTVHGFYHLMGYDHMEEEERLVMEERQREIMEKVQILRA